jgi:nitroreductase
MASEIGLGASVMTGPLIAADQIRQILKIKPSWSPVAFVPVGYPDESPDPTSRKEARKVTRWLDEDSTPAPAKTHHGKDETTHD